MNYLSVYNAVNDSLSSRLPKELIDVVHTFVKPKCKCKEDTLTNITKYDYFAYYEECVPKFNSCQACKDNSHSCQECASLCYGCNREHACNICGWECAHCSQCYGSNCCKKLTCQDCQVNLCEMCEDMINSCNICGAPHCLSCISFVCHGCDRIICKSCDTNTYEEGHCEFCESRDY